MTNINAIITALDDYLDRNQMTYVEPCEANQYLQSIGLLRDRPERCGLPLRRLLRAGQLPHAYQEGVRWRIPHSGSKRTGSTQTARSVKNQPAVETKAGTDINLDKLRDKYEEARAQYRPESIRLLIVAEAPPDSIDRFFYYAPVSNHDHLFLGIMEVIYPEAKTRYLHGGRQESQKRSILGRFQADGFYLVDVLETPKTLTTQSVESAVPELLTKLDKLITKDTPIIIIKATVFDSIYPHLLAKGYRNVSPERIPFPASGQQTNFRRSFTGALTNLGFGESLQ